MSATHASPSFARLHSMLRLMLGPEKPFYVLAALYGLATSLLTLAVPFSVQVLITTLSNTATQRPVIILSLLLLVILGLYGLLVAAQHRLLEYFKRRFYARIVGEIAWRNIHADPASTVRPALANRYFEIMTVQQTVPILITSGFALLLQTAVGLVLVAFYHPAFLVFNLVIVALIAMIWRLFAPSAIRRAVALSQQKHHVAAWIAQQATQAPPSPRERTAALAQADATIAQYLTARRGYYRATFRQIIGFLALYALASASLLGIGGSLVIAGELTLGQLVAAELVLSAIFFGLSKAGEYLAYYYELSAAVDKLAQCLDIPVAGHEQAAVGIGEFATADAARQLPSLRHEPLARARRSVMRMLLLGVMLIALILSFTPWMQTAYGIGDITALNPAERAQPIHSLVKGRVRHWYVQDGNRVRRGDPIVALVDNDPQLIQRLQQERDALAHKRDTLQLAMDTANLNAERQSALHAQGLSARKDAEAARIRWKELKAQVAQATADLARKEVELSRQGTQIVAAPLDGFIMHIRAAGLSTQVQEGDVLATFVPDQALRAVQLYVRGLDAPLVTPGRSVRLMFEGWPSVQFSGWPAVAVGTFAGTVVAVDAAVSPNGKFRVLVAETPQEPWPDARFLRLGARAQGWVLLSEVPLGYELWRQMNNFPPVYDQAATPAAPPEHAPVKGAP